MASLATNFTAFLFLFPVGLKRLVSSSSLYLTNPSLYRSKPWYFFCHPKYANLDLYILLIALPISSFSELFLFFDFSGHQSYRFAFSQQALTLFLFWVLLIFIFLREYTDPSLISDGFVFICAGVVFLIEFSFTGKGVSEVGLGGAIYGLLGKLSLVCASSCLYLAIKPAAFWAEFLLSSGLVIKGTWVLQAGLSLGTDAFSLKGCGKLTIFPGQESADVKCDLDENSLRGVVVMNLLFIGHAIGVLVLSLVLFGLSSFCNRSSRFGDASGPLLAQLETDNLVIRPVHEYELE